MKFFKIATLALFISTNSFAESPPLPRNNLGISGVDAAALLSEDIPRMPQPQESIQKTINDIEAVQLKPSEINRLKDILMQHERTTATPYSSPAMPVSRTYPIRLDPGSDLPVLRLSMGILSTLVFTDSAGNPWPIAKIALNRNLFRDALSDNDTDSNQTSANQADTQASADNNQAQADDSGKNILALEPLQPQAYGNATITLVGQPTPIILMLTSGQREVDVRVDMRVPGLNPKAPVTANSGFMGGSLDTALTVYLDNTPPPSAKELISSDPAAQAWTDNGKLYVRSRLDVMYPAFVKQAKSTTGLAVYEFSTVTNAITFTQRAGQPVTIFFESPL